MDELQRLERVQERGDGMRDTNLKINVETEGMEEAQEQVEMLADAYDGFPAQVTIKNSILKKLKSGKGKKFAYSATYKTNKVKGTVKVKK